MSQVLLISYVERELEEIQAKLQSSEMNVKTAVNMREGFQQLSLNETNLIVMNFDQVTEVVAKHVTNLRSVVDQCPLLVLGHIQNKNVASQLRSANRTLFLNKPYLAETLQGLSLKMIEEPDTSQQIYRRYPTEQAAHIELYGKNIESESVVLNLSYGGAYVEIPEPQDIQAGDMLRLNVELSQTHSRHRMHAKVVWTTRSAVTPGWYGIGVTFIQAGDVFREMQNR